MKVRGQLELRLRGKLVGKALVFEFAPELTFADLEKAEDALNALSADGFEFAVMAVPKPRIGRPSGS
jgi:hypothetical protein